MAMFRIELLKKKAEIDRSFLAESERQEKILVEMRAELNVYREQLCQKNQDLVDELVYSGRFTEKPELPHYVVTKAVIYCKFKEISDGLEPFIYAHLQLFGDDQTLSKQKTEDILINFFRNVDDAIKLINDNRTGWELAVDFLKSALNLVGYVVSFTAYPGFFRTAAQPFYETKSSIIKLIHLKNELALLSHSDANFEDNRQVSLNT
ncbi:hypothetical protein [Legionella sp. PC997]|uniref:hypothetical protein n=1 Tax=Legionella sp. PC997 TaxID=2755562 RepID=UPI0015FBFF3A|nr:hypothetical protein [Legionella sp. PC997]QMT60154.1 hypothetical protein HBNCFIEN_01524 [Legionella sp. PC997]